MKSTARGREHGPSVRRIALVGGFAGAFVGALLAGIASAQEEQSAPESLLPPGFDDPAPSPSPSPARPQAAPTAGPPGTAPLGTPVAPPPGSAGAAPTMPPAADLSAEELADLPSLEELEDLSTDQLDDLFGLKPKYDMPPAARRALSQVGLLAPAEGGLKTASLARQPQRLVRAVLAGIGGPLVSRWGHILLRRALASRLSAPQGMDPVEFAALRIGVLNRMGEFPVARALAQDVDAGNWNQALGREAITAYIGAADPVGACPYVQLRGLSREERDADPRWVMLSAICNAYAGESTRAVSLLDAAFNNEIAPEIDILLARRYAGAAGRGQRGVSIEWEEVDSLNAWRFALANAVGEPVPDRLFDDAPAYFTRAGATMAMAPLASRARFASRAASEGILSARALVDLYSELYADEAITGPLGDRAQQLRSAYMASDPAQRIKAIEGLWNAFDADQGESDYAGYILTAYAAARVPPASAYGEAAGGLVSAMLAAGLDRDAASWDAMVDEGSEAWALIALGDPIGGEASTGGINAFIDDDSSAAQIRSRFLIAGLAGLGRLDPGDLSSFESRLSLGLDRQTRWRQMISRAAQVNNQALVVLLVGLGMQGESWSQMTPLHLYTIIDSLVRVGLEAEARMIAAEAVARG